MIYFFLAMIALGILVSHRILTESRGMRDYRALPSIYDERCPVCKGRIPGPVSGIVRCNHCDSTWLSGDFHRQANLVCSDCGSRMVKRYQDPYDEQLYQVNFLCGRQVIAHLLDGKREAKACQRIEVAPDGQPDHKPETIPTDTEKKEFNDGWEPLDNPEDYE